MTVFIGCDHRGFELKNRIVEYLQQKNIRVEDMGNYTHDPEDDYPMYAKKAAEGVLQHPDTNLGIVICGSGIGVSIAANRHHGIRCGLCLTPDAARHGRANDHLNMLALASDYTEYEDATHIVDAFLETEYILKDKYVRRSRQLDS